MSGEKTEQPSPKRLREARRKGQIPRSRLLSSSAVTLGGVLGLLAGASSGLAHLREWAARLFSSQRMEGAWEEATWLWVRLCGPACGGALAASLLVSLATVGFESNPLHVLPKLERISPAAGFKRLFSLRPLREAGVALGMVVVVAVLVWNDVEALGGEVLQASWLEGAEGLSRLLAPWEALVVRVAWVLFVLGVGDYALARRRHLRDLMMSREELKREFRESEGDPRHKGQRRALHRQLAQGGPARGVQKASAVVINPTHIAVALRYDARECEAPYLVAKAREEEALSLREEALRLGVPIVRDIPLARSLIHYDVGEPIPEELYQAAAVVLRTAMETRDADVHPRRQT
ncbi:EscU/YscU/HrcU family type III secretion system export apparatus switch protein [Myxococcus sp. K15C18031901]|uniref:EscU/YscU/HrcU family type III secretion system export apparatus switch protein n=1 Tax=Myxococcus dinghuensis TaxID=2906761 RepID=UPI0020A821C2|nr:EscU/YscU/HrcU family type III secretion system export apparatus switch protein [Myxococcus dinghuensis]MCP3103316.1 EscU/YscU/HrcU family type III secretion system export apparatus switch protein [Myxococcus dinghuensis]